MPMSAKEAFDPDTPIGEYAAGLIGYVDTLRDVEAEGRVEANRAGFWRGWTFGVLATTSVWVIAEIIRALL